MPSFRSMKCAVVLTHLLWRDQGLRTIAATRRPRHLLLALSMSSVPHRGSNADGEVARVSKLEKEASDDLMFIDSSQQDVSGRLRDWEEKADSKDGNWRSQLAWLTNIVEPALSMYKGTPPPGELAEKWDGSASGRSLVDIVTGLLKSTAGMQQWGLADITLGLYLLSLRHEAEMTVDTVHGEKVTSDFKVQEWIYHLELAWGAYMKDAAMLSRVSMLQEENVVKFVSRASVMRPAYYVGVDHRQELVILSIRGTQTIQDLITDLSSDSEHAEKLDGEPVHYGSVEAARWFLRFEVGTLRRCLTANEGFGLLVIGHSLGGAAAALLGMLLRKDSQKLLGVCPDKIRVVGIGTPPCVSKVLALRCRDFTSTLVLQDDVIPRVSTPALIRLRNEILCTDWNDVLKEGVERKGLADLIMGTIQAVTSVQDAARKYSALARRTININGAAMRIANSSTRNSPELQDISGNFGFVFAAVPDDQTMDTKLSSSEDLEKKKQALMQTVKPPKDLPELVAPGTLFHICTREINTPEYRRNVDGSKCSLWKGKADSYLGRIVVSSNMFSDHRCESYYYSLRDALKNLPNSRKFNLF